MAKLSPSLSVGFGILRPKLKHLFKVTFNGESHNILTKQVVSTDHSGDFFIINFEDDRGNELLKHLLTQVNRDLKFKIDSFDSSENILATWLYEATLVTFTPVFDYAEAGTHLVAARFRINQWNVAIA